MAVVVRFHQFSKEAFSLAELRDTRRVYSFRGTMRSKRSSALPKVLNREDSRDNSADNGGSFRG